MLKFLQASDGKMPFMQILLGIVVGALGMFVYVKFWKPKILFPVASITEKMQVSKTPTSTTKKTQQSVSNVPVQNQPPQGCPIPSFIDFSSLNISRPQTAMPKLPSFESGITAAEELSMEEDEDEDEDEEEAMGDELDDDEGEYEVEHEQSIGDI